MSSDSSAGNDTKPNTTVEPEVVAQDIEEDRIDPEDDPDHDEQHKLVDGQIKPESDPEKLNSQTNTQNNENTIEDDGKLHLIILKYDQRDGKARPGGQFAQADSGLKEKPLSVLRASLLGKGFLGKNDGNFCTKDGVLVPESTSFTKYLSLNGTKAEDTHEVYISMRKRLTKMDSIAQDFLKKGVDLTNKEAIKFADAPAASLLTSRYKHNDWAADSSSDTIIHASDMTEKEWGIVMQENNLLSGQTLLTGPVQKVIKVPDHPEIIKPRNEVVDVKRSYYSAFALKQRKLPNYDITFDLDEKTKIQIQEHGVEVPDYTFRIPRFYIADSSNVKIFETNGVMETTMANSSFTQTSISAALGGSGFGISAAIHGGANWSNDKKSASSHFRDTKYMHAVYEFPRVELILNEETLELSDECKADIKILREKRSVEELKRFEDKYGIFFARSIHLGGRLVSIDESDSISGSTVEEKISMLKASAGASLSGYGAQAEVNYSHTDNSGDKSTKTEKKFTHNMSWSANGGDTTLCNNPPKWCPTVNSFYNWRVMRQDDVINIYQLIGKLEGYEDIPQLVDEITHLDPDPLSYIKFSLDLKQYQGFDTDRRLAFGALHETDHEELVSNISFSEEESGKPLTLFQIAMNNQRTNVVIEEKTVADNNNKTYHPRFKYGVRYPVSFMTAEDEENDPLLQCLQLDENKTPGHLYGKHNQASNIMVEFHPVKRTKKTWIDGKTPIKLRFIHLKGNASVSEFSNLHFKDVHYERPPTLDDLADSIPKPQRPLAPVSNDSERTMPIEINFSASGRTGKDSYAVDFCSSSEDLEQTDLYQVEKKFQIPPEALEKYRAEVEEWKLKFKQAKADPNGAYQKAMSEYTTRMNSCLTVEDMVFELNYHNTDNEIILARQHIAAEALVAKKKKEEEEKIKAKSDAAKQAEVLESLALAHDKEVERRKQLFFGSWEEEKKKYERVALTLDDDEAKAVRAAVAEREKAMTQFVEYGLDQDLAVADRTAASNPFFPAARKMIDLV